MAAERTRAVCGASAPRVVAVGAGIVDETFEPAGTMAPEDLQVELADGDIGEFPFDQCDAVIQVRALAGNGNLIPSVLTCEASVHGY